MLAAPAGRAHHGAMAHPISLEVLYFGGARDAAGTRSERLSVEARTVAELRQSLLELHPELESVLARSRLAVDEELAEENTPLRDGAEVAVIPPVAGGSGLFRVTEEPLRLAEVVEAVSSPELGGVVTFSGVVRAGTDGRRVLRLEYESYQGMAERVLARIGAELGERHGSAVAVVHRVGVLQPGELAVVIACAAPHRREAFECCAAVLERLKHEAPVWKREVYEDGSEWVGLGP